MTTYRELTAQVADQYIAAMEAAEKAVRSVADGTQRITAAIPTFGPAEKFAEIVVDNLPKPIEIVEANYEFTNRLLTAQRDLALRLLNDAATQADKAAADA
ncbi:hypothetical protein [Tsukamurella soli]|uniref:PE family protein n=1 Tax=Tsukamurella soli TaxID=644556 RepID=A0ABP8JHP2_9ACTN